MLCNVSPGTAASFSVAAASDGVCARGGGWRWRSDPNLTLARLLVDRTVDSAIGPLSDAVLARVGWCGVEDVRVYGLRVDRAASRIHTFRS